MNQHLEQQVCQPSRSLHFLYHELRPGGSSYSYVLDTSEFAKQVKLFSKMRGDNAGIWPEVTFDDGHISNYTDAMPILQSGGLIARFFITAGWTGTKAGYMGWQELRSLHLAGQMIGAHGWSHTLLTHCNEDELQSELRRAKQVLEDRLGIAIDTMSLPGGRYNRRVLEACRNAGYSRIYTSIPRVERDLSSAMIGRLNVRGDMTLEWIADLLTEDGSRLAGLERQYRMKAAVKTLLGDRLYEKVWAVLNRKADEAGANEDSAHYQ